MNTATTAASHFPNGTIRGVQCVGTHVPTRPVYKIVIHRKKNKYNRKPAPLVVDWEGLEGSREYGQYYDRMTKVEIFNADGALVCTYTKADGWR